jgi:hypothetical protein
MRKAESGCQGSVGIMRGFDSFNHLVHPEDLFAVAMARQ